jgi:SRSO17 transposase
VQGLLSSLKRKNGEAIAYLHDQERKGVQHFIGEVAWDHEPLLRKLAQQVAKEIGEADGVLVFDPSGFPKKGKKSVGVARQWIGRVGKVDNGQVGVYLGYVSRQEHALVDMRLYLPKEWTNDRKRCAAAGVPKDRRSHRTRHALALEMLDAQGPLLPHRWITGDDEMGRPTHFRRDLQARNERYLLMVPSNTLIRDLDAPPPQTKVAAGTPRPHGSVSTAGRRPCPHKVGRASRCVPERRDRWWWRWRSAVSLPRRIGAEKDRRKPW